jgi:hypothetical protein
MASAECHIDVVLAVGSTRRGAVSGQSGLVTDHRDKYCEIKRLSAVFSQDL